jgi:hypothetical protein
MRRPEVHARHVPIHRRGLLGLLLTSLAGAMAFLALASPAVAFLRSFEMVIGQGTSDSSPVKDLVLSCPSDKSAIGTGASALSSSGEPITGVGLNTTQLVTPGTGAAGQVSWLRAVEADPEAVSWGLFGQVFCLAPTTQRPTSATSAQYLRNVFTVNRSATSNSTSPKDVTVFCPPGWEALGGGFDVGGPGVDGDLAVRRAVRIAAAPGGFGVLAHETDPTTKPWGVAAYAVCGQFEETIGAPLYAGTLSAHSRTSPANSQNKNLNVWCGPGQLPVGGAAQVFGPNGTPPPGDVVLRRSVPLSAGGWTASASEEDPVSGAWHLHVRVICTDFVSPTGRQR